MFVSLNNTSSSVVMPVYLCFRKNNSSRDEKKYKISLMSNKKFISLQKLTKNTYE
ncbi:hypothetical protein SAMN05880574_10310 [Chryseobacterium sp. RU37D]|nr:hypothetical protein SAMN05880574_10310 [Chryseobacterium sp. RU37D]